MLLQYKFETIILIEESFSLWILLLSQPSTCLIDTGHLRVMTRGCPSVYFIHVRKCTKIL